MSALRLALILPAAGSGRRFGGPTPKIELPLQGKPVFAHALDAFLALPELACAVIAVPAERLADFKLNHAAHLTDPRVRLTPGGQARFDTVRLALKALPEDITHIAVHDAARPLVPADMLARLLSALRSGHQAVLPACPIADTLRQDAGEGQCGPWVDRNTLLAVQTPQIFAASLLRRAQGQLNKLPPEAITDDASLVQSLGEPIHHVPGDIRCQKLTHPDDLPMLEALLNVAGNGQT